MLAERCQLISDERRSWLSKVRGDTRYFQTSTAWHLAVFERAGFFEVECDYLRTPLSARVNPYLAACRSTICQLERHAEKPSSSGQVGKLTPC